MKYPEEVRAYIFAHHKGISQPQMVEELFKVFGFEISRIRLKSFYGNNHLTTGLDTRFKKGQVPWSAGKTQEQICKTPEALAKMRSTQFAKGHAPANVDPVGTEKCHEDGYLYRKIAEPDVWKQVHRIYWEEQTGQKLGAKDRVIFLDGNTAHISMENLMLTNESEIVKMNKRKLRSGDPEITKVAVAAVRLENMILSKERQKNDEHTSGS